MLFGVGVFVVLPGLLFECKLTQINFFGCGKGRAGAGFSAIVYL